VVPVGVIDPTPRALRGYYVLERIDAGGMGAVYRARHLGLGEDVAIKTIRPRPGVRIEDAIAEAGERFEHEKRLHARLKHDRVVAVTDWFRHPTSLPDGKILETPFLVMTLVPGARTLDEHLLHQELGLREKLSLFDEICAGVEEAHRQHIVHRDLKPRNILVAPDRTRPEGGVPKVIDFGLAIEEPRIFADHASRPDSGHFVGTVRYASPEQCARRAADARSDVFSLGLILYEMVTGKLPFPSEETPVERAHEIHAGRRAEDPSSWGRELPWDVAKVLRKSVEVDPSKRYQSVGALRADVRAVLESDRPKAVRGGGGVWWWIGMLARRRPIVMSLLLLAVVAFASYRLTWPDISGVWVQKLFSPLLASTMQTGGFSDVRMVETRDDDDLDAEAARLGIELPPEGAAGRHRPLTAEIVRRLARGSARVLVSDLYWGPGAETNAVLAEAIGELRKTGGECVLVSPYRVDAVTGRPDLDPGVFDAAQRWGAPVVDAHADGLAIVDLMLWREGPQVFPSLSLAGLAAYRYPGTIPRYQLTDRRVEVLYERMGTSGVLVPAEETEADQIPIDDWATLAEVDDVTTMIGMKVGDRTATYVVAMPSDETLDRAGVSVSDVLRMDDVELRRHFAGKAVVLLNHRSDAQDKLEVSPGRLVSGGRVHAASLQALIRGVRVRFPPPRLDAGTILAASALGLGLGIVLRRTWLGGLMSLIGLLAVLGATSVLWYRASQMVWNPIPAMLGATLALVLGLWIWRGRPGLRDRGWLSRLGVE
jgi:hypothetical protein